MIIGGVVIVVFLFVFQQILNREGGLRWKNLYMEVKEQDEMYYAKV